MAKEDKSMMDGMFNTEVWGAVLEEMNRRFPQVELGYRNSVVASAMAKGKKDKLTSTWLMRALIGDVEDGFLTYEQAVYVKDEYYEAICAMKKMFG